MKADGTLPCVLILVGLGLLIGGGLVLKMCSRRTGWAMLIVGGVMTFTPCLMHAGWVVWWYGFGGYEQHIEDHRDWILHHADHDRILVEARQMLQNQAHHPQAGGSSHPANLPPYLEQIDATSIHLNTSYSPHRAQPNYVMFTFERRFGLAAYENEPASPDLPTSMGNPQELIPGLWYYEY